MRHRSCLAPRVLTIALVLLFPDPVSGQSASPGAKPATTKSWKPPRTPDGQPDLQGIWRNNDATPLERPRQLEGTPFLTDEEVADLKKRTERLFGSDVNSDFAGGDNFFLAALANPSVYKNPNSTGGATGLVDRVFDNRTSLIVDPPDGRIPMTPEGQQRRTAGNAAAFLAPRPSPPAGPEDLSAFIRCISYGVPRLGGAAASYNSYYQIVQTPGYVMLMSETTHDARIIPLDGRPHLRQDLRHWDGDSRGRWQGDTLIVETTNFTPKSNLLGAGEHLHVVERFTRAAADRIDYEITLTDSTTWTRPWTALVRLHQTPDKIYEDACHEGNLTVMTGVLGAALGEDGVAEPVSKPAVR